MKCNCGGIISRRNSICLKCHKLKEPEDSLATVLVFGLMGIGVVLVIWAIAVRAGWV